MKVVFINGSPRAHGNIARMLEIMRHEAELQGADTEYIPIASLNVRPCKGCMSCRTSLTCSLPKDDAQSVLGVLRESDVLIIGSPCYWGNMPGPLKTLFDRMVYGMMGENSHGIPIPLHKGKRAVIVSTCTTPWPYNIWFNQSHGTVKAIKGILKWSGFRIDAVIEKGNTKRRPHLTEREQQKCRNAIHKVLKHRTI